MDPVVVTRELSLAAPRPAVWALITDTERLNRLAGMPPVEFEPVSGDDEGAARFLARQHFFGLELVYEERPFEWSWEERFSIARPMRRGPLEQLELSFDLADGSPGNTQVRITLSLYPRSLLVLPLASIAARKGLSGLASALEALERRATSGRWPALRHTSREDGAMRRAEEALLETGVERAVAERLVDHVRQAPDVDVGRIRPFELADRWGLGDRVLLGACLRGVQAGLLELRWELICPSCRTAADQVENLAELADGEGHCQLCDIRFGLELDRSVEATFEPAAAVRKVDRLTYCIGGPARTPHVLAQVVLAPGAAHTFRAPAAEGRYRLFLRGGAAAAVTVEAGAPPEAELEATPTAIEPSVAQLEPGGALAVRYGGDDPRHVKLEHLAWASRAATAHHVSTFPEFRKQFSEQVLHPGVCLRVGRAAVLFSDLTGSTQLYSDVGDAAAFRLVQRHFDLLEGLIADEHGAVVKTIGDAVMAAFQDEGDAVRAAVRMLAAFPGFAREEGHPGVGLKLGVHAGACYAVTANDRLDYFGQTVNVAARLQAQAGGDELVTAAPLAELAEREGWLGSARVRERFTADLKGVEGRVEAVRIVAAPAPGAAAAR